MDAANYGKVQHLEQRVARLELICEAMWNVLTERTKLTDEDLQQRMAQLDLSDGKADGRVTKGALTCPNCQKPNARRHEFCMWCGETLRKSPFD